VRAFLAAAVAAALAGCYAPPPTFGELPEFSLTAVSSDGKARPLTLAELKGRVWIADFVFTRCGGPCPALSARMAGLQKSLPAEIGLLSVSVDPARDTPAALADYASKFEADPARWLFLTGPKDRVMALVIGGFKVPAAENAKAPSEARVTHSARFVLVDKAGRLRGFFDSDEDSELASLKRAARRL
jgi:protein SCO1/2